MNDKLNTIADLLRNIMNKFVAREKKPHDYGTGELLYRFETHLMDLIGRYPDINVNGLAKKMSVTKGAISQVVNKLVKKGYVDKVRDNNNRRQIKLNLTQKGKIVFVKHGMLHEKINSIFINKFSKFSTREKKYIEQILIDLNKTLNEL